MNTNNVDEDENENENKNYDNDNSNSKEQQSDNEVDINVDGDVDDKVDIDIDVETAKKDINIEKNVDDKIQDVDIIGEGNVDVVVDLDLMDVKQKNTAITTTSTENGSLEDSSSFTTTTIKTTFNDKKNFRDKDYKALEKSTLEASTTNTTTAKTSSVKKEITVRKIQPNQTQKQTQTQTEIQSRKDKDLIVNNITSNNSSSQHRNNSSNSISTDLTATATVTATPNANNALNSALLTAGKQQHNSSANSSSSHNNRNSSSSSSSISNNNSITLGGVVGHNNKDLSVENNIDSVSVKLTNANSKIYKLNLTTKDSLENTNKLLIDNNNSGRKQLQTSGIADSGHECENVCERKQFNVIACNSLNDNDDTHTLLQKISINNPFYPYLRKQASNSLKELRRLKRRKRFLRRIKSETDLSLLSKHFIAGTEQVVVVLDSKSLVYKPNSYLSKQITCEQHYQYQATSQPSVHSSTVITNPFSIFHDDDSHALTLNINTMGASTLQRPIKKHRSERSLKRLYELELQKQRQLKAQEQSSSSSCASYYYGGLPVSRFERQDFTNSATINNDKDPKANAKKSAKTVFKHFSLRKRNEQLDSIPPQLKRLKISYPNRTQSINSLRRAYDSTTHVNNKSSLQSSIVLARKCNLTGTAKATTPNYFERLQAKTRQGIQKIREKCRNFRGNSVYSDGSDGTFNPLAKDDSFRFIGDRANISNYENHARAFNCAGKHATIYKSYKSEIDLTRNLQYLDAYLEENFDQSLQDQKKSAHSVGRVSGERLVRERARYLARLQSNQADSYNETPKYAQPNRTKAGHRTHKRSASALGDGKVKTNYENLGTLPMTTQQQQQTHIHSDSLSSSDYASVFSGPTALPKPQPTSSGVTNSGFSLGDEPPVSLRYEHPKMSEYFLENLPASYALELADPEAAEALLRASHESDSDFYYQEHLGDESIRILVNDAEDDATNADWYQQKLGEQQHLRQERNFRAHSYNENLAESDFYRSLNQHLQEEHLVEQQQQQHQRYLVNDFADFSVKGKYESYLAHFQRHKTDTQAIDYDNAKHFLHYNSAEIAHNDVDADCDDGEDVDVDEGDKNQEFSNNFDFHQTQIDVTTPTSLQYPRSPFNSSSEKLQLGQLYTHHQHIGKQQQQKQQQHNNKQAWSPTLLMTTSESGVAASTIYDDKEHIIGNLGMPANVTSNHKEGSRYISDVISGAVDDGMNDVSIVDGFIVYATENSEMLNASMSTTASKLHTPTSSVTLYSSKSPSNRYKYHHNQQQQQQYQQKHYQQQRQKYQNPPVNCINSSSLSTSSSSTSSMSQTNQSKLQQTATGSKQCKYTNNQQQQHLQQQQHPYAVRRNSSASNASSTENFDNFIALRGSVNNDSNVIGTSVPTRSTILGGTGKSFADYKNPTTTTKQRTNVYDYKQQQPAAPTYQRQQQHLLTSPTSTGTPLTTALNYYGNYVGSPGVGVGSSATDSLYTASSSTNSGSSTATSSSTSSSSRYGTTTHTAIGMQTIPTACGTTTNTKLSMTPSKATKTLATLESTTQNTANNHSNALQTILSQGNLAKPNVTAATPLLPAVMTPLQKQQHQPPLSSMQFGVTSGGGGGGGSKTVETVGGTGTGNDFILEYEC